eukprot:230641-Rhodomonas_salina.2
MYRETNGYTGGRPNACTQSPVKSVGPRPGPGLGASGSVRLGVRVSRSLGGVGLDHRLRHRLRHPVLPALPLHPRAPLPVQLPQRFHRRRPQRGLCVQHRVSAPWHEGSRGVSAVT